MAGGAGGVAAGDLRGGEVVAGGADSERQVV